MSETIPPNRQQEQAASANSPDTANVEQTMKRGYAEMPGYRSSEAVEIRAKIKPRIELFISYAHKDNRLKERFCGELQARLESSRHFQFGLSLDNDLLCGDKWNDELQERLQRCDYGILLISSHFLASTYIREHEVPLLRKKCFPVALKPIDINNQELHGLEHLQIFFFEKSKPFEKVKGSNQAQFIIELAEEIEKQIQKHRKEKSNVDEECTNVECITCDDDGARKLTDGHLKSKGSLYDYDKFIDGSAKPGMITHKAETESSADTVKARPYILNWALETDIPFFALLGDFGTGKTFTCRMLAREINARHDKSPEIVPLCIYIDLRRVSTRSGTEKRVPRLINILQDAIEFTRDPLDKSIVTPEKIVQLVRSNRAMIIFDGLDEKTVHFTPEETNQFIAELWSIREQRDEQERVKMPPQGKLLISCRTHYFRNVFEQNSLFLGRDREGKSQKDYQSCTLLPFDTAQIREYLEKRLGCNAEKIKQITALFEEVHNLKDLASRPYTLSLITEFIPDIERLVSEGRPVNTASLYDTTVENWLARDEGKHEFSVPHKKQLMKSLAAEIHKQGGENLKMDALDEWLDEWLSTHPAISEAYRGEKPRATLKKDLRTATFVIREEEDSFSFAHTSLQEYFLAGFIVDALSAKPFEPQELAMSMPSKETLDFIADMLATDEKKCGQVIAALTTVLETAYHKSLSELAFALWLKLHERGMRTPTPGTVHLENANLSGLTIVNLNLSTARFDHASLRGTSFRNTLLSSASFSHADLVNAEFLGCDVSGADFRDAEAVAGIWRNCNLGKSRWSSAQLKIASFVSCQATDTIDFPEDKGVSVARCSGVTNASLPAKAKFSLYDDHSVRIETTGFSPDGAFIASASVDGTVKLWDAQSGKCIKTLTGHTDSVNTAKFSPDGTRIISASNDKTIKLWNIYSGQCISTFSEHDWVVNDSEFSPDGTLIISASSDNTIKLWNVKSGKCLLTLSEHSSQVNACSFSPDGKQFVSASSDNTLKLWSVTSGHCIVTFIGHSSSVWSCAFSHDGTRIISASSDNTLKLWDAVSGKCLLTFAGHSSTVCSCAFNANNTHIVSASSDNTIKIWDAVSGKSILNIPIRFVWFNKCSFSPDGTKILSTSEDSIKLWNANSGNLLTTISKHGGLLRACAVNNSASLYVTGSNDHSAKLWEANSGRCLITLSEHSDIVSACAFSPDGSCIITASHDNTLKLWDAYSGRCTRTFIGHSSWVYDCAFSPDGTKILSVSADDSLRLWDAHSGKCILIMSDNFEFPRACAFSPNGKQILSASAGFHHQDIISLKLWNAQTGEIIKAISEKSRAISSCMFSPDGNQFLTACLDSKIKLWDTESGQCVKLFEEHTGAVWECAFSPDGKEFVSASSDNSLKIWKVASGRCILTLSGHTSSVFTCAYFPDGSKIISGSSDKTLKLWDALSGNCIMTMANLPDNETASWSETELKLLSASPEAWRWIGIADGCRRLPIELLDDPPARV